MWDPNSADHNFKLTVHFNKQVSADGYARARDNVLLTKGVKMTGEDAAARTMDIAYNRDLAATVANVAGVEKTEKVRISGFGQSGGCFGPRRR